MQIKVMSFNALDRFGEAKYVHSLLKLVENQAPDVAFFCEAYEATRNVDVPIRYLTQLGYKVVHGPYGFRDGRLDRHGFIGITRIPFAEFAHVRRLAFDGLQGHVGSIEKPASLRIYAFHANDRSEAGRLKHLDSLPQGFVGSSIVMGDLNAMHGSTVVAQAAKLARPFTRVLPTIEPAGVSVKQPFIPRVGSLARRFTDMASGTFLHALEMRGLRDADPTNAPTIHGIAQLDHIMVSRMVIVKKFAVLKEVTLSDHKPIIATLDVP